MTAAAFRSPRATSRAYRGDETAPAARRSRNRRRRADASGGDVKRPGSYASSLGQVEAIVLIGASFAFTPETEPCTRGAGSGRCRFGEPDHAAGVEAPLPRPRAAGRRTSTPAAWSRSPSRPTGVLRLRACRARFRGRRRRFRSTRSDSTWSSSRRQSRGSSRRRPMHPRARPDSGYGAQRGRSRRPCTRER